MFRVIKNNYEVDNAKTVIFPIDISTPTHTNSIKDVDVRLIDVKPITSN